VIREATVAKRYELSDAQWARIAELLPGKKGDRGRTAKDNRIFVDGVLWVLRSGARWSDLPERYGIRGTASQVPFSAVGLQNTDRLSGHLSLNHPQTSLTGY
jgi:transposase